MVNATDRDAMLSFSRALPQEDPLFLRLDLTEPSVIDYLVHNIEAGYSTFITAYDDTGVIGYAIVHRNPTPWTRRMDELHVNVSQSYRAQGVGKNLNSEIFDIARGICIKKLMANMTADQLVAQAPLDAQALYLKRCWRTMYKTEMVNLSISSHDIEGHLNQVADIVKI